MKILIVEDNQAVRRIIRHAISDVADEIIEATAGDEVVQLYGKEQPDLVLMDIRMPRVDGLEATRKLRNRFPQARVIIVTDMDDEGVRSEAMMSGACGYALKQDLTLLDKMILETMGLENQ